MNMREEKRFLLTAINAKYIHSNLAVYSLRAYAAERGIDVEIAEFTINQPVEVILRDIYACMPDVLMMSCYIWNIGYIMEIANEFHKLCPDIPIWLGGPEVSFNAESFIEKNTAITGIMLGEGENTLYCLCRCYQEEGALDDIDGIAWKDDDGNLHINPKTQFLDMDDLPFCYTNISRFANRIIYYESSRGCPFACSYCLSSVDKNLRLRSLKLVYPELQFFLDNNVQQVKFVDRTFNCDHEHAFGIWKYIYEHDNGITNFHFEISADLLNEEELSLLSKLRPGLVQLEIGVQSVNRNTIREIHRTMNLEKLKSSVLRIQASGNIHQHLDLIAGLPHEDYHSFQNSFNEIYRLKPQQLQLGFLKVLKGSYMYDMAKEYHIIYTDKPPYEVMATKWLTYSELQNIKLVEEMLEIHYNSAQFLRSLAVLESNFESPFTMYLRLAEFYRDNGYSDMSCTRIKRSEIFYEFALQIDSEHADLYAETLIYDLYIRERSKTRPVWVMDHNPYRKQISAAIQAIGYEKKYCHVELFVYNVSDIDVRAYGVRQSCVRYTHAPQAVLFDYVNRKWDGEAHTRNIKLYDKIL